MNGHTHTLNAPQALARTQMHTHTRATMLRSMDLAVTLRRERLEERPQRMRGIMLHALPDQRNVCAHALCTKHGAHLDAHMRPPSHAATSQPHGNLGGHLVAEHLVAAACRVRGWRRGSARAACGCGRCSCGRPAEGAVELDARAHRYYWRCDPSAGCGSGGRPPSPPPLATPSLARSVTRKVAGAPRLAASIPPPSTGQRARSTRSFSTSTHARCRRSLATSSGVRPAASLAFMAAPACDSNFTAAGWP